MKSSFYLSVFVTVLIANLLAAQTELSLESYGVVAQISDSWQSYRYRDQDGHYIQSFGMPKTWSESEKANISNAVAVVAIHREDIDSIDSLIQFEKKRLNDVLVSHEEIDSADEGKVFRCVTEIKGFRYQSQSHYQFKNDVGYVFSFTATEGTFDKNLPKFKEFLETIKYFEPKSDPDIDDNMVAYEKAIAYYRFGVSHLNEAQREIEVHLDDNPEDIEGLMLLARIRQREGDFRAALETLEKIPALGGESIRPAVCFQKAQCYYAIGEFELARQHLQPVSAFFSVHPAFEQRYDDLMAAISNALQADK